MANTYSQINIHIVFAVKYRQSLIHENIREEVQKYIAGIVENRGQKLLAIYCMPDHTHILIGMKPILNLSELVRDIKAGSSKFINDKRLLKGRFSWQNGFGAFSHSNSVVPTVINYILNQKEHHAKKSFRREYLEMLEEHEIAFDERYIFHEPE